MYFMHGFAMEGSSIFLLTRFFISNSSKICSSVFIRLVCALGKLLIEFSIQLFVDSIVDSDSFFGTTSLFDFGIIAESGDSTIRLDLSNTLHHLYALYSANFFCCASVTCTLSASPAIPSVWINLNTVSVCGHDSPSIAIF